ncbi:Structural maintenance of chromosomes protein 6 [Hondaea fermentalgiana]|uniref:Structural maintenance of chromosomes protein 6 n=1 Tax=Hondaea fermentalgiana TaxID=2315210 RepID=A0A2R5G690_9STRA|nr:Structural maintenance of chromosomes protein 6 [Hondaea fermentalgiana]|eukprot:GBG23953.1 Structural maintenance of chromosomes protein 6 [Hondaea fermentalgiana]
MSAQKRRRGGDADSADLEDVEDHEDDKEESGMIDSDDAEGDEEDGLSSNKALRREHQADVHAAGADDSDDDEDDDEDDGRDELDKADECGKVKKIECTNFMCHRRLEVNLGRHINFITGQNGSGKSAIVAALQICLGLSARNTKRGSKLSNLIRHGSNADAIVAVELLNEGPTAYKPDLYGPVIRIERVLKPSGTSSFRILNAKTKKCVSTQRRTVDDMVSRFNTFVDNPSCILDQETSKTFLRGSAKDKYNVFMRATNLEALEHLFLKEEHERARAKAALEERKKNFTIFEDKLQVVKKEIQQVDGLENHEQNLKQAKNELVWIKAQRQQDKCKVAEQEYERLHSKTEAKRKDMETYQQRVDEAEAGYESFRADVEQKQQDLVAQEDKVKRTEATLVELGKKQRAISKQLTAGKRLIQHLEDDHKKKDKERANLARDAQSRNEQKFKEAQRLREEIDEKTKDREELASRAEIAQQHMSNRHVSEDNDEERLRDLQQQLSDKKREHSQLEQNLRSLKDSAQDPKMAFGKDLPHVLNLLERNKDRFSRMPVHIGLGCKLKDQRWRIPVEHHLRNTLRNFVVAKNSDYLIMKDLCSQARIQCPQTVIMKFQDARHSIPEGRRFRSNIEGVFSFEDVLEIQDPNVYNALVDSAQIESCGLCESSTKATQVAFEDQPQGLNRLYDTHANCYQVRKSGSHYKQSGPQNRNWPPFFVNDTREFQNEARESMRIVSGDIRALENQVAQTMRAIKKQEEHFAQLRQEFNHCRRRKDALESQIEDLNSRLDRAEADVTNDDSINIKRDSLTQMMENLEADIAEKRESLRRLEGDRADLESEMEPLKAQCAQLKKQEELKREALEESHRELKRVRMTSEQDVVKLQRAQESLKKWEEREKVKKEEFDLLDTALKRARTAALQFTNGEEIDVTNKDEAEVKAAIEASQKALHQDRQQFEEQYGGDSVAVIKERLMGKYDRLKQDKKAEKAKIKYHLDILGRFKKSNRLRVKKTLDLRSFVEERMQKIFESNLSYRNHSGSVNIDQENGTLNFTWAKSGDSQMSQTQASQEVKDAGQLSGGESSFTSLAFLMALGSVMKSPWRVMDEFDVFMDQDNRKLSLELIVDAARKPSKLTNKCQFILITPHDVSSVAGAPDVHKIRMRPPESDFGRAQQTTLS